MRCKLNLHHYSLSPCRSNDVGKMNFVFITKEPKQTHDSLSLHGKSQFICIMQTILQHLLISHTTGIASMFRPVLKSCFRIKISSIWKRRTEIPFKNDKSVWHLFSLAWIHHPWIPCVIPFILVQLTIWPYRACRCSSSLFSGIWFVLSLLCTHNSIRNVIHSFQ